jgi:hypothetical protein
MLDPGMNLTFVRNAEDNVTDLSVTADGQTVTARKVK